MSCEQAADAIMALINAKPRSPTRDEIVGALAAAGGATEPQADAGTSPRCRHLPPIQIMLALLPALGEAQYYDVHDQDSDIDDCHGAIDEAIDAILEQPEKAHPGDLAVAVRNRTVEGCYGNEQCEAAQAAIVRVLLHAAGLTEEQCDQHTHYVAAERRIGELVHGTFPD